MTARTKEERIELLRATIEASGLSQVRFATDVLLCDPRTVRRWLAGDRPISQIVVDFLEDPKPRPWPAWAEGEGPDRFDRLRWALEEALEDELPEDPAMAADLVRLARAYAEKGAP